MYFCNSFSSSKLHDGRNHEQFQCPLYLQHLWCFIAVVFQSLSHVRFFAIPWTAACQASLSLTISWSLLQFRSVELVMPSNHLRVIFYDQLFSLSFISKIPPREVGSYTLSIFAAAQGSLVELTPQYIYPVFLSIDPGLFPALCSEEQLSCPDCSWICFLGILWVDSTPPIAWPSVPHLRGSASKCPGWSCGSAQL